VDHGDIKGNIIRECFVIALILVRYEVLPAVAMNGLFFPEDGGSRFLQIIGNYLPDYKVSHPKRQ
jgi:hypothetical protein